MHCDVSIHVVRPCYLWWYVPLPLADNVWAAMTAWRMRVDYQNCSVLYSVPTHTAAVLPSHMQTHMSSY